MPRNPRRRLLIDRQVQGVLLRRMAIHWLLFMTTLTVLSALWVVLNNGPLNSSDLIKHLWVSFAPAFLASAALLPIVLIDSVRLSNKFAGPMYRLRRVMQDASRGKRVAPVYFRKEDYWREFAEDFNRLVAAESHAARERTANELAAAESGDISRRESFVEV